MYDHRTNRTKMKPAYELSTSVATALKHRTEDVDVASSTELQVLS